MTVINAASGEPADLQDAADVAVSGDTVIVPVGHFDWNGETVTFVGGVIILGASFAGCKGHLHGWAPYTATTIFHNNQSPPQALPMLYLDGQTATHDPMRVSSIRFLGTAPADEVEENSEYGAIEIQEIYGFRIDHCDFIDFCGTALFADAATGLADSTCYGLIDHCVNDNPYKESGGPWYWGYGFYARGNMEVGCSPWDADVTHFFGQYGATVGGTIMYIEDCHLSNNRHSTDCIEGGFPVVRYSKIEESACGYEAGLVGIHGAASEWVDGLGGTANSWWSGRGTESYNNTIIGRATMPWGGDQNNWAHQLRGGSALVYDNTYTSSVYDADSYFIVLRNDDHNNNVPAQHVLDTYIWGNSVTNAEFLLDSMDEHDEGYTENVDYFFREPTLGEDGFTYTPYTYPHPLNDDEEEEMVVNRNVNLNPAMQRIKPRQIARFNINQIKRFNI